MNKAFKQLHLGDMEHGMAKTLAVLNMEPKELSQRTGLQFEVTRDDLDYLQAALFQTAKGTQFALVRHQHSPSPGTDLLANERTKDLNGALEEALAALSISWVDLKWINPELP